MDSKISTNFSNPNTVKDIGTLGLEDSDVKGLLLLNGVFRVGVDQTGQYLDIEPELRHAPLIISESGCNTNTKEVRTLRESPKHVDKITFFVDSDFAGEPVSRKSTTGFVAQIGNHTEIWINASELDSIKRWRIGVSRSGEREVKLEYPCSKIWEFQ